jgi:hypothetical protein
VNERALAVSADAQRLAAAQPTAHERAFRTHLLIIDAALQLSAAHRAVEASRRILGEAPAAPGAPAHPAPDAEVRYARAPNARARGPLAGVTEVLRATLRFIDCRLSYALIRLVPALLVASDCLSLAD